MLRFSHALGRMNKPKLLPAPPAKWAPSIIPPRKEFAQKAGSTADDGTANAQSGRGGAPTSALDFSDAAAVFRDTPTRDLLRGWLVFQLFRVPFLVKYCTKVQKVSRRVLRDRLFNRLMKLTVYGQFVGGEDDTELRGTIEQLKADGIYPVLDYAVESDIGDKEEVSLETRERGGHKLQVQPSEEDLSPKFSATTVKAGVMHRASARTHLYLGEENCDKNMENFVSCLKTAASCCSGRTAFVAIKLTALGRPQFLLQLSESLVIARRRFEKLVRSQSDPSGPSEPCITEETLGRWLKEGGVECSKQTVGNLWSEMDLNQSGSVDLFEWMEFFKPGKRSHELLRGTKTSSRMYLSEDDRSQMKNLLHRAHNIAKIAGEVGVRVMVDAEQTYYQDAIRHIAVNELMPVYNRSTPAVYNTIQCYLKDAPRVVEEELSLAKRHGSYYGVKLVRGAYMEQERDRAKEMEYPDPIQPTKEDTDSCYNSTVSRLMEEATAGRVSFMVASHNKQTAMHTVTEMDRLNISKEGGTVTFGQLYGMHDHITLALGKAGFEAYKYLPYGPVGEVLPYLCRRANENSSVVKGAVEYRKFIGREVQRRLTQVS